jgi:hypothetical protein
MRDLLGALALAWPRLMLFPGGLAALLGASLLDRWLAWAGRAPARRAGWSADALPPLLALALLPLPPARSFPYGIDLVAALALLEWPRLSGLARAGRLGGAELQKLLGGYGLLLLAAAAWMAGAAGIELSRLLRAPQGGPGWALLLAGAGLWLAALARLELRPAEASWALRLRALGLLLVGSLPLLAGLAAAAADGLPAGVAGLALPPAAALLAALALGAALRAPPAVWRWGAAGLAGLAIAGLALDAIGRLPH